MISRRIEILHECEQTRRLARLRLGGHLHLGETSKISSDTFGSGDGGDISIKAASIALKDMSGISTLTNGTGDGGSIAIDAHKALSLSGIEDQGSTISSSSRGTGAAGDISMDVGSLSMNSYCSISSSTDSDYPGGTIHIRARDSVDLSDFSDIKSVTTGKGRGGTILVETGSLSLTGGSEINSNSRYEAQGHGGSIRIEAREDVRIQGVHIDPDGSKTYSGIYSMTETDASGGDIQVAGRRILLSRLGRVSAESMDSGTGDAGNISMEAAELFRTDRGFVKTSSFYGSGGNIRVKARDVQLTHGGGLNARVAAQSGDGGNVFVKATNLVALENSDINASAVKGYGGDITIRSYAVFLASDCDLNATSQVKGRDGTVAIHAPLVDFSAYLTDLPSNFLSVEELLPRRCVERGPDEENSFIIKGREGFPPAPDRVF